MDITGRAFAVADGGFGGSISSDGDVSTTSTIIDKDQEQEQEQATVQSGELCGPPRRVCFIDEIGISPRRDLVTSIVFRPSTTTEEKKKLQYSPQDYAFFAMGDDYQREFVRIKRSEPQVFRWEDFVVYDGGYVDEIPIEKEEAMCEGGTVPRVETL
mmetsp:Transcript_25669/g.46489  ORF Transcript_25669/g.46489 Transcript_25669/m.46489 type:complete len:157 (+) Transcript_25669:392-862(+)